MRKILNYYKWHLIFLLLVLVCLIFILVKSTAKVEPDLIIGYVGSSYVNEDNFENSKGEIELMLQDANGDDKKDVSLIAYTVDTTKDIGEVFKEVVESESYHIYVAPKKAFTDFKNKAAFATFSSVTGTLDTLKDSDRRIYAVSLEDNSLAKQLGIRDTEGLYIAAADFGKDELSTEEKNGINITKEIIEKRKDYN